MIAHSLILILLVSVVPLNSLICYECACDQTTVSQCNCDDTSDLDDNDYCVIFEQRDILGTRIDLTRIPRNSTWVFVEDPYYILVVESIRYNLTAQEWYLWTNSIIFGCDWDLCNSPNLIDALPDSFKLSIDENWLDTNIYGTGSVDSCNYCPTGVCGDTLNPIDFNQCPITPCVNVTTCFAFDLVSDLETDEQCFYSQCAPTYLDGPFAEINGGKYRIDVEAIIYLEQDRLTFDVWEIDVYCAVDNCTRLTIFEEVTQQLSANISDLSAFPLARPSTTQPPPTTTTPIRNPLTCYSCECFGISTSCPCEETIIISLDSSYCVIVRENLGQSIYIYSDYFDYATFNMYVNEFPYALVEESIIYDENDGRWYTITNFVVYGCNWNLCNKPELIPFLPDSFQMRLPEAWLNSSVLGTGLPVRDCHECPAEPQCGTTDYLDANTCPIQPCNTTCLVIDTFDNPASDFLCYQSYCLPPDTEFYQAERHRIEIEGIVYASQPNVVDLWEVDIYCRADNCSRPGIFRELRQQLTLQVGTLAVLFNETYDPTIPQRRCYDCYCSNPLNCSCERTTIMPANSTYCFVVRENLGQNVWIDFGHIDQVASRLYIRDFPYLLVEESILYSAPTGLWNTITNYVIYGCNWDYCNQPNLVQYLPNSFQMRLPETWLNSSVLGTGQPLRNCHECPDAPICSTTEFIDSDLCPVAECNTTCLVVDSIDNPANNLECYQSFCISPDPDDNEIERHRVEIEGILYLQHQPRTVELLQVSIYCRADDCSQTTIFNDLESQLYVAYGDISAFELSTSTVTQSTPISTSTVTQSTPISTSTGTETTSTSTGTVTTSTSTGPQTTPALNASLFISLNLFIILLISILRFNFY